MQDEIRRMEERLRVAMLGSNVVELDALIDDRLVFVGPDAAVVLAKMAGVFKSQPFAGRYRYIRTWTRSATGWRVVAGSVCAVPE